MITMQTHKIDILDVATYLINHQNKNDYKPLKLQKLVFFVYAKNLIDTNQSMFNNDFESWPYGPVSPKLYTNLPKDKKPLNYQQKIKENYDQNIFSQQEKEIMDYVIEKYGPKTATELVNITHRPNSPWERSYISQYFALNNIPDKLIQNYYSQRNRKV
ncbi:Phage-Associated Protein [Strawberry lethal yellows phytoplasma (CPA) str. NZSb11]|uniref:Phage-Associated Protein n=2 Tax=Phytoplasma australiense TaxID=59748 RepID=R4RQX3_PHYAS|nr:Phage-Associated Protein [Strawberry lethal yellows phytoplasma (CPA) str. NZSb11]